MTDDVGFALSILLLANASTEDETLSKAALERVFLFRAFPCASVAAWPAVRLSHERGPVVQ